MPAADYRVTLDAFEGPLDLLLFLIRRDEVDIHDIPVARVTEQYLAFLEAGGGIESIDVELAGEFLVMASTLMELKSRLLMGPQADDAAPDAEAAGAVARLEDPRADLVRQLLAYKRYRDAALALESRLDAWESRYPGAAAAAAELAKPDQEEEAAVDLEDVTVVDLVRAFAVIMESVDFSRVGDHRVQDDETPLELHAEDVVDQLRRAGAEAAGAAAAEGGAAAAATGGGPELPLRRIFAGRTRGEAIGLFLAILELVRQQRVTAVQDRLHGEIAVRLLAG